MLSNANTFMLFSNLAEQSHGSLNKRLDRVFITMGKISV
jgi:hypothetical protein